MKIASSVRWLCVAGLCVALLSGVAGSAEDEFEDIPAVTTQEESGSAAQMEEAQTLSDSSTTTAVKQKLSFRELLQKSGDISGNNTFFVEISLLCLFGICLWSFMYGKITNRILAIKWVAVHKELFSEQFSLISAASNAEPNPDELLSQDKEYNIFKFYASGRKHCSSLLAEITLIKRHDIFWRTIDALAFPAYDKVTLKVALTENPAAQHCNHILFFLCRKGKQVSIRDDNPHYQEFTSQVAVPNLTSDLVLFTEVGEVIEKIFSAEDTQILNDLSDFVEYIGVTDLNNDVIEGASEKSPPRKVLTCTFRLPAPGVMDKIIPLIELSLRLIDALFTIQLSVSSVNKANRNRKILTDRVAKALTERKLQEEKEENEKKKLEKLEKEKEAYEKLPSHLKIKQDQKAEKKKKKDANKMMMKKR